MEALPNTINSCLPKVNEYRHNAGLLVRHFVADSPVRIHNSSEVNLSTLS